MNVKKKAIGIVIAAVLLFSFTFLAMAQTTSPITKILKTGTGTNAYTVGSNTDGAIASGSNASPYAVASDSSSDTIGPQKIPVAVGSNTSTLPIGSNTDVNVGSQTDNPTVELTGGDVDGDGVVTPSDARLTLRASVMLERFNQFQLLSADTDGDGVITSGDARTILRRSVGLFD